MRRGVDRLRHACACDGSGIFRLGMQADHCGECFGLWEGDQDGLEPIPLVALEQAMSIARVALAFGEVERATQHPDGRAETDATHTIMLALLVAELARAEGLNVWLAVAFAIVHDLVEAFSGDTCTARGLTSEQAADKAAREASGREQLVIALGRSSWAVQMVEEYERQAMPEARLVRYADKITPKLTHIANGGAALQAIGMSRADITASHERQGKQLAEQYPELTKVRALFDLACAEAERACVPGTTPSPPACT